MSNCKYYPASAKDEYLYYVEGYPRPIPQGKNEKWERCTNGNFYKYSASSRHGQRPCSSPYNQVLYCNPKFTSHSSQGTIPFDSETEDRRFKSYPPTSLRKSPLRQSIWTTNTNPHANNTVYVPQSCTYARNPSPNLQKPQVENYRSSPTRYQNYDYGYNASSTNKTKQNHVYAEAEGTESETLMEDEYTESEDDSVDSKYEPIKSKVNYNSRCGESARSAFTTERMMKNINAYNRHQPGKKLHPRDLETLMRRLNKPPVIEKKYMYQKSRCLDSTYEKAAGVLKSAKGKTVTSTKPESKDNLYEQYRRRQYSQLLLDISATHHKDREVALGCDTSGNVYLGSQSHVKQISSQYSVLHPKTQELPCLPIPEEQQSDSLEIKNAKKTSDSEQPVKLQKEMSEPIRFISNTIFHTQSEKTSLGSKGKLPILLRSRRIPRRKRNFVGIQSCAKALKKFTEYSQIAIQRQSSTAPNMSEQPTTNFILNANPDKFAPEPLPQSTSIKEESLNNSLNNVQKGQVTRNVNNMISKLDEIENLINKKNIKRDSSTSQSSFIINEGTTSTSTHISEVASENIKKKKKKRCPKREIPIPESCENEDTENLVANVDANSNNLLSFASTKSAIVSLISLVSTKLLSSNKTLSKYETDAEIFRSVFNLKHQEPGTSCSGDTRRCSKSSNFKQTVKSKNCKNSSDITSTSDGSVHLHDTTTSTIVKCVKPSNKTNSIVTVYPASKRDVELTADSATTNLASEIIRQQSMDVKKTSKIPKPKHCHKADESSSENAYAVRPKYKGKKRASTVDPVSEENRVDRPSAFNSLRSVFCIIVDFLFRYLRSLFVL